jgi:hypothetical protein
MDEDTDRIVSVQVIKTYHINVGKGSDDCALTKSYNWSSVDIERDGKLVDVCVDHSEVIE